MAQELNNPQGISREVQSSQRGLHPGLADRVRRQAAAPWLKPPQAVDRPALRAIDAAVTAHDGPLILDSFCGTGMSTAQLAEQYPDALVIGVDQSAHRLARQPGLPRNAVLVRAHCEAVWQHFHAIGQQVERHTLLYPNPWPKPGHIGRRIHGHPAFGLLPDLGGQLELRSNWQVYTEEFGFALQLLGHASHVAVVPENRLPTTLFERKYRASGHTLWSLVAHFSG